MLIIEFLEAHRTVDAHETLAVLALGTVRVVVIHGAAHYLVPSRRAVEKFRELYPTVPRSRLWSFPELRSIMRATGDEPKTFLTAVVPFKSSQERRVL
jgi:hypothetical protein